MTGKGKNLQSVKIDNRNLVLKLICTGQCNTRPEITFRTGLTKMTVTNIISELIDEGWIKQSGIFSKSGPGRKSSGLQIDDSKIRSIGVYISREYIVVSSITLNADVKESFKTRLTDKENKDSLVIKVLEGINRIRIAERKAQFLGIGVACIGPLDINNGVILSPLDFFGIENLNIKDILEKETGLKTVLNNDMNASALAELLYGFGISTGNFLYFGITHGVGCGIVINSDLYTGSGGYSGEIGHVSIDKNGLVCSCGNRGCLERYASMPDFWNKVFEDAKKHPESMLSRISQPDMEAIVEFAKMGDNLSSILLEEWINHIGVALISTIHLLNTQLIVIGHESALAGKWFTGKLQSYLQTHCMFKKDEPLEVVISKFNEKSPVIGSGVLVFDLLFRNKL